MPSEACAFLICEFLFNFIWEMGGGITTKSLNGVLVKMGGGGVKKCGIFWYAPGAGMLLGGRGLKQQFDTWLGDSLSWRE